MHCNMESKKEESFTAHGISAGEENVLQGTLKRKLDATSEAHKADPEITKKRKVLPFRPLSVFTQD